MTAGSPIQIKPRVREIIGHPDQRFRLLGLGFLTLISVTSPLWLPQSRFPQVPLVHVAGRIPAWIELSLSATLILCSTSLLIARREKVRRCACLMIAFSAVSLVGVDQHRLQPWVWQFLILSVVFSTARSPVAVALWRGQVIGIYAWSAWSKMDHSFCVEHGPFLLDGICKAFGLIDGTRNWPANVRYLMSASIPATEFLIALGLIGKRTCRVAVIAAVLMHVGLLLALGPFGHGHQPGVLIWNLFFIVQNFWLFAYGTGDVCVPANDGKLLGPTGRMRWLKAHEIGNLLAMMMMALAMIWPVLEPYGLCDHWPAWAVYAARPERVIVMVNEADADRIPPKLRVYLMNQDFEGWSAMRIDRWSLDALRVPIYPQDRFQAGVVLAIAREFELDQVRVVILGPANRWTGQRTIHQYDGISSITSLASGYRCNAFPRQ